MASRGTGTHRRRKVGTTTRIAPLAMATVLFVIALAHLAAGQVVPGEWVGSEVRHVGTYVGDLLGSRYGSTVVVQAHHRKKMIPRGKWRADI